MSAIRRWWLGFLAVGAATIVTAQEPSSPFAAPPNYVQLTETLQRLADSGGTAAQLISLATTHGGREVWLLQLAAPGDAPAEERPAILIVGGIDGDHAASTEVALGLCERLAAGAEDDAAHPLLARHTLYVIPRLNPDGFEAALGSVAQEQAENARPLDDDRDALVDEDGPTDLNGDGRIGVMRVPDSRGEWRTDPRDERLLRRADIAKGETGLYRLLLEGADTDGDGEINDDPPGGVHPNRNWPHFFVPGVLRHGVHQLSEPETRTLAEFVVDHPPIVAAIVYGADDNIVTIAKDKQRGPEGKAYRNLHPDDRDVYELLHEAFGEIVDRKKAPEANPEGRLFGWLYSQRGMVTIAHDPSWVATEDKEDDVKAEEDEADNDEASADDAKPEAGPEEETSDDGNAPVAGLQGADEKEHRNRNQKSDKSKLKSVEPGSVVDDPAAVRVAATDANLDRLKQDDSAFDAWRAFDHPTLGHVEIGGWWPLARTALAADVLDGRIEGQIAWLIKLGELLPQPQFDSAKVTDVGGGVWRVELELINPATLPTHLAIAREIEWPPFAVRPMVDRADILGGRPVELVDNIPGGGNAVRVMWLIRGAAGAAIEFQATNPRFGTLTTTVKLNETGPAPHPNTTTTSTEGES